MYAFFQLNSSAMYAFFNLIPVLYIYAFFNLIPLLYMLFSTYFQCHVCFLFQLNSSAMYAFFHQCESVRECWSVWVRLICPNFLVIGPRSRKKWMQKFTHTHIHTILDFCWILSHCGIFRNELVDRAAKIGTQNLGQSIQVMTPLSLHEGYSLLENACWNRFKKHQYGPFQFTNHNCHKKFDCSRQNTSIIYRLKINAFRTKYSKNIKCICGAQLTTIILCKCQPL